MKLPTKEEEAAETSEAGESPAYQAAEEAAGVEQHGEDGSTDEGGESAQDQYTEMCAGLDMAGCDALQACLDARRKELGGEEFSDEGMPT